jgi:hypothetical protein
VGGFPCGALHARQYTLAVSAAFSIASSGTFWAECTGGGIVSVDPEITVMQVATLH